MSEQPENTTIQPLPHPKNAGGLVAGMGTCYALGTFTDNFYKNAVVLVAGVHLTWIQSVATILYALPFILFSAGAGWLADRMVKRNIVVAAKTLELGAMIFGAICLVTGQWWGILLVIFVMGLQATAFSPALNGSIPENFPAASVPRVNSLIKLASTCAILLGIAASGLFLDLRPGGLLPSLGIEDGPLYGKYAAGLFIIVIAVAGVLASFTLRRNPPRGIPSASPFPWRGPIDSFKHFLDCRKDQKLFLVLLAEAYFYGVAAMAVVSVANLSETLSYSKSTASMLSAVLMVGVAIGAIIAGRYSAESWKRSLRPSAIGMGIFLTLISQAPSLPAHGLFNYQLGAIAACLFLAGICGGIYLIPLASFIQVRPAPNEKGKIIGVSNFLSFVSIAVWGCVFGLIGLLPPAWTFIFYGLVTILFAVLIIGLRLRRLEAVSLRDAAASPFGSLLRSVLALRYKVRESGLDKIPLILSPCPDAGSADQPPARPGGILFLPNHPALIDPLIIYSRLAGLAPRPLADQGQMSALPQRLAGRAVRAIVIPDLKRAGKTGPEAVQATQKALSTIVKALKDGDNILLYPAGRVYRSGREEIGANSGVAQILSALPDCRVVLARTRGLWGSSFSYAEGRVPRFLSRLFQGLRTLMLNGLFFTPRREVTVEFSEPADLPRDGDKKRLNAYLEEYYRAIDEPAISVPRFFFQGYSPSFTNISRIEREVDEPVAISQDTQEKIYSLLCLAAGLEPNSVVNPEMSLAGDLGLDSLALMDFALSLEQETGYSINNLESLNTVRDCLLAASGALPGSNQAPPAPAAWFVMDNQAEAGHPLTVPEAPTLIHCFLEHARSAPSRPLLADRTGIRTRKQVLTAALALAQRFAGHPGNRIGIMLPASPAATIAWIGAHLAGKEPVMLNWTVGKTNLLHCLDTVGLSHAFTAGALLDQLHKQGNGLDDLPLEWVLAETTIRSLSVMEKLRAAALANLHCLGLRRIRPAAVPDIAAILFTSGSEARPKAVPLSHANILANARDLMQVLGVRNNDRVLSMLPPFHSFGLMVGNALPAATGIQVASHTNPTESGPLVRLLRDFRLTLLGATPTFLEAMLKRAESPEDLSSLRYGFVGAEKCPAALYRLFAESCPQASLCEGYGITECSPVISVNPPGRAVPGTIGFALPTVHTAIVVEDPADSSIRTRAAEGQTGMLLVRGPSIFSGYLGDAPDPFVSFEDQLWYRTGDLVSRDQDGRMTFQGRLKRFVKIGGEMVSLPQIEKTLLEALDRRADLPADGKPFLAVEVRTGSEEQGRAEILGFTPLQLSVQEANQYLREAGLSSLYSLKRIVQVREIPLLGTGKTDYQALKRLVD